MAKNKFDFEASDDNGHLQLKLSGRIWQGDVANSFSYAIDHAINRGITSAELYLSTPGGSVFEAVEIVKELKRLPNFKIKTGAIVASAGTYILSHFHVIANKATQFMIHKPMSTITGNEDEMQREIKALQNITNFYRSAYAKRFNKTEAEIDEMWKLDYWMDTKEAMELNLANEVEDEDINWDDETVAAMVACGCPNVPQPSTPKPENKNFNNSNMDRNVLISVLGLPADASDAVIEAKVKENKSKADHAAEIEANVTRQKQESAEKVVNQAILDKKITADLKSTYVGLHMQDPVKTEEILAAMKGVTAGSNYTKETPDGGNDPQAGRENWTIDDYLEKDPVAFEKLINDNPEKVKELNAAYAAIK